MAVGNDPLPKHSIGGSGGVIEEEGGVKGAECDGGRVGEGVRDLGVENANGEEKDKDEVEVEVLLKPAVIVESKPTIRGRAVLAELQLPIEPSRTVPSGVRPTSDESKSQFIRISAGLISASRTMKENVPPPATTARKPLSNTHKKYGINN